MDFARYANSFQELFLNAKNAPKPVLAPLSSLISIEPQKILILAPHPDDECLMSGFAIRAQEEWGAKVQVVPFSYGSKKERRAERKKELNESLALLQFELLEPRSPSSTSAPSTDDELTQSQLMDALVRASPDLVITSHLQDGHPTHIHSSELARFSLARYTAQTGRTVHLLQSEFWQSMPQPNLLIPLSSEHLIKMGNALLKHAGEMKRNPYHLSLPAWAMEQVRRGSEMLQDSAGNSAKGSNKQDCVFGQIYRFETMTS
jgi:LmbE family N-acetylglucosaminyl deacetylase